MKISTEQGVILGNIIHYGGKALLAMGACFLPWPYACVAWGWLIANTAMTVAIEGLLRKIKIELARYRHGGAQNWVRKDLKGKHREHSLCFECFHFKPDSKTSHCPRARLLYALSILTGMVTPVYECDGFVHKGES